MNKKILFLIGILSLLFLSGCVPETKNDILNVELYDGNKNLVSAVISPMAVINDVPNVKYIAIKSSVKNVGNVELTRAEIRILAPLAIEKGFVYTIPDKCTKEIEGVVCYISPLTIGNIHTFSSGLIDVNQIGYGTFELLASGFGTYFDEEGRLMKTDLSKKSYTLIIKKDPIKAGVVVDIGSGGITPPPPCTITCDCGVLIMDRCIADPIEGRCPCDYIPEGNICVGKPLKICPV